MGQNPPTSYWLADSSPRRYPAFDEFGPFDVAIVGGGIVGLCTAYHLVAQGRRPIILESRRILEGVTGHTTAKVTALHDLRFERLLKNHGRSKTLAYADANLWAVEWLFEAVKAHSIECDLRRDFACTFSIQQEDANLFDAERATAEDLGLPVIDLPTGDYPVRFAHTICLADQARFHPVRFLRGIADYLAEKGVPIFEASPVESIDEDDTAVSFTVGGRSIRADKLVIATNYPISDSGGFIARLAPYRAYAMAVEIDNTVPDGMFIAHSAEMQSWRKVHDKTLIIGAGQHKVGQVEDTENEYRKLENWARLHFPIRRILNRWSTQDNRTPDGMPYVGKSPNREHTFVATGFDGWGMANGMASGKLLADLISGNPNPWQEAFNPGRFGLHGAVDLIKENVNAVSHLVGDKLRGVSKGSVGELRAGQAGIFETEDGRVAAYRDETGRLSLVSPVCTHIGCQVAWNPAEKSWDCPCHGSRFAPDGSVLHGPAIQPLSPVTAERA